MMVYDYVRYQVLEQYVVCAWRMHVKKGNNPKPVYRVERLIRIAHLGHLNAEYVHHCLVGLVSYLAAVVYRRLCAEFLAYQLQRHA